MGDTFLTIPWCTWLIIGITSAVSVRAFRSYGFEEKYIFNPEAILAGKEYYRLITPAFLHADGRHLLLNMVSLLLFGGGVEDTVGHTHFLLIYFGAVAGGNLLSLYVHRNHEYRAYGASGGVCGIIFASILLHPGGSISSMYLPIGIPNWLYAIGFLLTSFYGMKGNNRENIGHDAHLGGAILGFGIAACLHPQYARHNPRIFWIVLLTSVGLLVYLWKNPLFLPASVFEWPRFKSRKTSRTSAAKQNTMEMDAVLDKISKNGIENLTQEEKSLLNEISAKYRRQAESSKPNSDLVI